MALPLSGVAATDVAGLLDLAEAAMRDGLPSLAWDDATNALSAAGADAELHARAVFLAGSALERLSPPADRLAWLDSIAGVMSAPGAAPSARASPSDSSSATSSSGQPAPRPAPLPPAIAWLRARALSSLGRHSEAAAELAPLVAAGARLPPGVESGAAARDYAHALAAAGRVAEAAEALEGAAPSDPGSAIDLARLHSASGRSDKAAALLRAVVADESSDTELRALASLRLAALPDSVVPAAEALAAFDSAPEGTEETLPPDLRALSLATRAVLLSKSAPDAGRQVVPPESVALARRAVETARSADSSLQCRALLLRLLAGAGGAESGGEAREVALELVSLSPGNPVSDAAVADAAATRLLSGDPETALALCELHASSFPASPSEGAVQTSRAEALVALGRPEESAAAWLRAAESAALRGDRDARASALLQSARMHHEAGIDAMALTTLDSLLALDPAPASEVLASAMLLRAECLAKSAPDDAATAFSEVAERFPDLPEAAEALFRAGSLRAASAPPQPQVADDSSAGTVTPPDAAEEMFRRAADSAATNVAAFAPLGEDAAAAVQAAAALALALRQQRGGQNDEALQSLLVAAGTPDGGAASEQAASLLPGAYLALGRSEEAVGAYHVFTNRHPHSPWMPDAEFWIASRAFDEADWTRAASLFASFADRWPESPRAGHALRFAAVALFRAGNYEEALAASERFVLACPGSSEIPAARFTAAESLARLLRFADAEPLFARVATAPGAPPALAARAALRRADCVFAMAGDDAARYREALSGYRAASAMPGAEEAGFAVECAFKTARCAEKSGDPDEALRILWHEAMVTFERAPRASDAVWYSRAVFAVSDALRARGRAAEADAILVRLAATSYPGADEAARRLSPQSR